MSPINAYSDEDIAEVLKPQSSLDWADDVEEEEEQLVSVMMCSEAEIEELLRPDTFDWADDMEDEQLSSANTSGSEHSESEKENIADEASSIVSAPTTLPTSGLPSPTATARTAVDHDEDIDSYHSWVTDVQSRLAAIEEYRREAEIAVASEFCYRDEVMHADSQEKKQPIHHFNWYGEAIRQPSGTPASHSLLYILSRPKTPGPSEEVRIQSILNRATQLVDPVIYDGDAVALQRRGQDLINAVTGRVFKHYSPHGIWQDDEQDRGGTVLDNGVMEVYGCQGWVVANGFYDHPMAPTRDKMYRDWQQHMAASSRRAKPSSSTVRYRRDRQYTGSVLRYSSGADTDTCENMSQGKIRCVHGKYQWWESASPVKGPIDTAALSMPEEDMGHPVDNREQSPSTEANSDTDSERSGIPSSLDNDLIIPGKSTIPKPLLVVSSLSEWILSDAKLDQLTRIARRKRGLSLEEILPHLYISRKRQCHSYAAGVKYAEKQRRRVIWQDRVPSADSMSPTLHSSTWIKQDATVISESDNESIETESQDDTHVNLDGHVPFRDEPRTTPYSAEDGQCHFSSSVEIRIETPGKHETERVSCTISIPTTLVAPDHGGALEKDKKRPVRKMWSKLIPKWLQRQRIEMSESVLSVIPSRNMSETQTALTILAPGSASPERTNQDASKHSSLSEPISREDPICPTRPRKRSRKKLRRGTSKLLDEKDVSSVPALFITAADTIQQGRRSSLPPQEAQQKSQKRSTRKAIKNFLLDGLSYMNHYPLEYI